MQPFRTEGVILNALDFQDYDKILTVFTQDEGLIKLIFKKAHISKARHGAVLSPLCRAEFTYVRGKSELYKCREICLLNPHLSLRQNLPWLQAGCDLVQTIHRSQMLHKPAPALYKLLIAYLEKVPLMADPHVLGASLRLKILRHDGLFCLGPVCETCHQILRKYCISSGEIYCDEHAPPQAIPFDEQDVELVEKLAFSQTFSQLKNVIVPADLIAKIKHYFQDMTH